VPTIRRAEHYRAHLEFSIMRITPLLLCTFTFLAIPSIAHANNVSYKCGANPTITVFDGGSADSSGVANSIAVNFSCVDVVDPGGNTWSASGTIRAIYTTTAPKSAYVEVFNAQWISEGPNLVGDTFVVRHNFPVIGGAQTSSSISGDMIHPGVGLVDFVNLSPSISIAKFIGGTQFVDSLGGFAGGAADPIAFADSFGWTGHLDPVAQIATIPFYLGVTNDAFRFTGAQRLAVTTSQ
jgi:hypothetical protein